MLNEDDAWRITTAKHFLEHFENTAEIKEFDTKLFYETGEKLTAFDSGKLIVSFLD